ncbi:hypothetical protein JOM56_015356 [Amanita muscaria]
MLLQTDDINSIGDLSAAFNRLALAVENLARNQRGGVRDQEEGQSLHALDQEVNIGTSPRPLIPSAHNSSPTPAAASASATLATTAPARTTTTDVTNTVTPVTLLTSAAASALRLKPKILTSSVPPTAPICSPPPSRVRNIPTPDEVAEHANGLTSPNGRWYLVIAGRQVGVFANWDEVSPLVLRCTGAIYRRLDDCEEAVRRYKIAYDS